MKDACCDAGLVCGLLNCPPNARCAPICHKPAEETPSPAPSPSDEPGCPDGSKPVNCLINPCSTNPCKADDVW